MRIVLLLAVLAASCAAPTEGLPRVLGGSGGPATWPLRGTPAADADAVRRRPVVVKVDGAPRARPQTGFADADLVLEILVEGGTTRFAVVFHSADPARVGPVRSARTSDLNYLRTLAAIVAHVGASESVTKQIRDAARGGGFVDVDQFDHPAAFERTTDRVAPYNVYTSAARIRQAAGRAGADRVTVRALRFGAAPQGGTDGTALTVPYGEPVRYEYDAGHGAYRRTYAGGEGTRDAQRGEVLPENVVVILTDVTEIPGTADAAGAPSVDFRATGTGKAVVLRDGRRFDGTWTREGDEMYAFRDTAGADIALKPGLTWIHIVPANFDLSR